MMCVKSWQTPWRDSRLTSIGELTAVLFFDVVERAVDAGGDVLDQRQRIAAVDLVDAELAHQFVELRRTASAYWLGISIGQ